MRNIRNHRLFKTALTVCGILVLFYFIAVLFYVNRVLPNTRLGLINIGDMSEESALKVVFSKMDEFEASKIKLVVEQQEIEFAVRDLGVYYDRQATAAEITGDGFAGKFRNLGRAFFIHTDISLRYFVDFNVLSATLNSRLSALEIMPKDASLKFDDDRVQIEDRVDGKVIDYASLMSQLGDAFDRIDNLPISIALVTKEARIGKDQLDGISEQYGKLVGKRVNFTHGYDTFTISANNLLGFLKIDLAGFEDGYAARVIVTQPIEILDFKYNGQDRTASILIDSPKLEEFFIPIAKTIDRPTVDATLRFEGGKIEEFTPAIDGQKLDVEAAIAAFENTISVGILGNEKTISLKLPVAVTTAKVANEKINELGIRELIGRGVSYFAGSIPNRAYNISLGADRINGTLVAPGEIFSFNASVGEVSAKTGYKQAYVISSGRTVLDDGGGICQVSTTVFRAALNAGLPIVSRTGHAYRVGYYEQRGFKPGLDATVWAPSVDFKFKNDTKHHILVQTIFDPANSRLEVDLYGTLDGRRIEMGEPVVTNQTPPPPEIRQEDPSLPKGTVKQVDFAAWGAHVYFTRKVYRGNELIIDDVFKTNYRPWQAVYLVGTGG